MIFNLERREKTLYVFENDIGCGNKRTIDRNSDVFYGGWKYRIKKYTMWNQQKTAKLIVAE